MVYSSGMSGRLSIYSYRYPCLHIHIYTPFCLLDGVQLESSSPEKLRTCWKSLHKKENSKA